jgi:hypothetical protein
MGCSFLLPKSHVISPDDPEKINTAIDSLIKNLFDLGLLSVRLSHQIIDYLLDATADSETASPPKKSTRRSATIFETITSISSLMKDIEYKCDRVR